MSLPREKIESEALDLPVDDRARLAQLLIASLDEDALDDPAEVEKAWEQEIYSRLESLRLGRARLIPADEVLDRLRRRRA